MLAETLGSLNMLPVSSLPDARFIRGHTRPDYLRNETLVDIFRGTARRVPDKLALSLIGRGESLTYAELDRRSNLIATAWLRATSSAAISSASGCIDRSICTLHCLAF